MENFRRHLNVTDLRVHLGTWAPSEDNPYPPFSLLKKAKVWTSVEARMVTFRDSLGRAPLEVEECVGGAEGYETLTVSREGGDSAGLTVFIGRPEGAKGAASPNPINTWTTDVALAYVSGQPIPQQLEVHLENGNPTLLWSSNLVHLSTAKVHLETLNPELRWVEIAAYYKPDPAVPFTTYQHARKPMAIVSAPERIGTQV